MRVIISPAKNMRIDNDTFAASRLPVFLENTKKICRKIQGLSYDEAKRLWKCSDKIAQLNFMRFADMKLEQDLTPAIMAYDGLQYMRMKPSVFTENALDFIIDRICILSAFYGVLYPFDGIVPYRLEMQAELSVSGKHNLYDYWGDKLYKAVIDENDRTIINLASKEYSKAVKTYLKSDDTFITCSFGTIVNGKIKQKAAIAKMARGEMVRYIAENRINTPEKLKNFAEMGFSFDSAHSTDTHYIFTDSES